MNDSYHKQNAIQQIQKLLPTIPDSIDGKFWLSTIVHATILISRYYWLSVHTFEQFLFMYILKVILCASEHICSIVWYCFRSFFFFKKIHYMYQPMRTSLF